LQAADFKSQDKINSQGTTCRSRLAGDSDLAGDMDVDRSDAIAGKPAPTGLSFNELYQSIRSKKQLNK
jgi:hypothetical protein